MSSTQRLLLADDALFPGKVIDLKWQEEYGVPMPHTVASESVHHVPAKETAMITITRSASIAPGKTGAAMAFGHQIAKYIKEKHNVTLEVLMPIGGNPSRIAWLGRYDGIAQWETLTGKLLADKEYLEILAKNSDAFLPGSVHDDIWRRI